MIKITLDYQTAREVDSNGYWTIKRNPISKVGEYDYTPSELGIEGTGLIKVYKTPEGYSESFIETVKNKPLIVKHSWISKDDTDLLDTEVFGHIGENVEFDGETLYADLYIQSNKVQALIDKGFKELSMGATTSIERDDDRYIMKHLTCNHLALVEAGRCGSEIAVLDTAEQIFSKEKESMFKRVLNALRTKDEEVKFKTIEEIRDEVTHLIPAESRERAGELLDAFVELIAHSTAEKEEIRDDELEVKEEIRDDELEVKEEIKDDELEVKEKVEDEDEDEDEELEAKVADAMAAQALLRAELAPFIGNIPLHYTTRQIIDHASTKLGLTTRTLDGIQGYIAGHKSSFSPVVSGLSKPSKLTDIIKKHTKKEYK